MLKLYFRSWNEFAAVPSMVSTSPIRVMGPVESPGAPLWVFRAGPAITSPFRVPMKACVKFGLIVESCTWSQHTNSQKVERRLSKFGSVEEGRPELSLWKLSGTKVGLFGRFDRTSRVKKVIQVSLSTLGS